MPIGPQPRGARGTVDRPYSALNLRLLLAGFGLVVSAAAAGLLVWWGRPVAAVGMGVLALIALGDLVVVQLRRRARRRADPARHSLFE